MFVGRICDGEICHSEAVLKGRIRGLGFQGLAAGGGKEDAVQRERIGGGAGHAQMGAVDGIEGSSEERKPHEKKLLVAGYPLLVPEPRRQLFPAFTARNPNQGLATQSG